MVAQPNAQRLRTALGKLTRLITGLMLLTLVGCATSPTGRTQLILISPDAAIIESETAYLDTVRQLEDDDKLVNDPLSVARVARITGRLVSIAIADYPESADWKWSVAIVDDAETVNAWCMAGGRMAVYTGLFDQLELTDDEFAQIMDTKFLMRWQITRQSECPARWPPLPVLPSSVWSQITAARQWQGQR